MSEASLSKADTILMEMERCDSTQTLRLADLRERQSEYVALKVPSLSFWSWLKRFGSGGK